MTHLVIHDYLVCGCVEVSGFLEEVLFNCLVFFLVGLLNIVCSQSVQ